LRFEIRTAGLDLVGKRIPVAGWPALDDVDDGDLAAVGAYLREQLVEELAGGSDERFPLLVLVEAGALADEEDLGVQVSGRPHDLRASLGEPAPSTGQRLGFDQFEFLDAYARGGRGSGGGHEATLRTAP
jgi:hypothetical protein